MKFVLKSIATVLIFCVCLSWISFKSNKVLADNEKCFTYLVLGLDDAAQNADVIMLLSYIPCENRVSFVQIPRDTYL